MDLVALTEQLSSTFDGCLEFILSDAQQQQQKEENNEGLEAQLATLKASFFEIESQLKSIRLKALSDKEESVKETNGQLKRDIDIKKKTIDKYLTQLNKWEDELPALIDNSRKASALRTDGTDFDSDVVVPAAPIVEDDEIIADEVAVEEVPVVTTDNTMDANNAINDDNTINNNDDEDDDEDDDDDVEFEEV